MDSGEVEKIRNELDFVYRKGFCVVFIVGSGLAAAATLIVLFSIPSLWIGQTIKASRKKGKMQTKSAKDWEPAHK